MISSRKKAIRFAAHSANFNGIILNRKAIRRMKRYSTKCMLINYKLQWHKANPILCGYFVHRHKWRTIEQNTHSTANSDQGLKNYNLHGMQPFYNRMSLFPVCTSKPGTSKSNEPLGFASSAIDPQQTYSQASKP